MSKGTSQMHCCSMMAENVSSQCEQHPHRKDCPDALVDYFPSSKSYVIMIHDGGSSGISIKYCPWCGSRL